MWTTILLVRMRHSSCNAVHERHSAMMLFILSRDISLRAFTLRCSASDHISRAFIRFPSHVPRLGINIKDKRYCISRDSALPDISVLRATNLDIARNAVRFTDLILSEESPATIRRPIYEGKNAKARVKGVSVIIFLRDGEKKTGKTEIMMGRDTRRVRRR